MDTETGASIGFRFWAAVGLAVAVVVGTVSQGHTEQLAALSECTSKVSASVFTDSLGSWFVERERKEVDEKGAEDFGG